jgi:hypothetical protein
MSASGICGGHSNPYVKQVCQVDRGHAGRIAGYNRSAFAVGQIIRSVVHINLVMRNTIFGIFLIIWYKISYKVLTKSELRIIFNIRSRT